MTGLLSLKWFNALKFNLHLEYKGHARMLHFIIYLVGESRIVKAHGDLPFCSVAKSLHLNIFFKWICANCFD